MNQNTENVHQKRCAAPSITQNVHQDRRCFLLLGVRVFQGISYPYEQLFPKSQAKSSVFSAFKSAARALLKAGATNNFLLTAASKFDGKGYTTDALATRSIAVAYNGSNTREAQSGPC